MPWPDVTLKRTRLKINIYDPLIAPSKSYEDKYILVQMHWTTSHASTTVLTSENYKALLSYCKMENLINI
jgi:hypothetical protein